MLSVSQTCKMALPKSVLTQVPRHAPDRGQRAHWTSKSCQRLFCYARQRSFWFFDLCFHPLPHPAPTCTSGSLFLGPTLCLCCPQRLSQKTPDILVYIKEQNTTRVKTINLLIQTSCYPWPLAPLSE